MAIGENIKRIRIQKKMTQKELGEKLGGITQQQIGQWENGNKNPKLGNIQKLAAALEVSLFDLVDQEEYNNAIDIEVEEELKRQFDNGTIELLPSNLLDDYSRLNDTGKHEAEKRVHELTEIPRYTKKEKNLPNNEE